MNGLLWGLLGALLIGASDCIARVTAQRVDKSILIWCVMALSSLTLTLWFARVGHWPPWHVWAFTASAMSGALNILALYLLYIALARGPVAVASPAASSFSVMVVGLNAVAGEPWELRQLLAVVVVVIGVIMLSQRTDQAGVDDHYDHVWLRTTALFGLGAALAVSLRMFLAQEAAAAVGALNGLYLNRAFALGAVSLFVLYRYGRRLRWQRVKSGTLGLVGVQAALETGALGAFLYGSAGNGRIPATIGFSVFAVATALFAWLWLGERIGWHRGLWMLVVAVGVVMAIPAG